MGGVVPVGVAVCVAGLRETGRCASGFCKPRTGLGCGGAQARHGEGEVQRQRGRRGGKFPLARACDGSLLGSGGD